MHADAPRKSFPIAQPPSEPINSRGQHLVDLSLIYDLHFTATAPIEDVVNLLRTHQEIAIAENIAYYAHPIKIKQGHVQIRLKKDAPPDLSTNLKKALQHITGDNWMIVIANSGGSATLSEIEENRRLQELADVAKMPVVETVLKTFPEAELVKILPKPKEEEETEPPEKEI